MTNGEKIQSIFPNISSRLDAETGIIITKWADNTSKFFKASWWNAEYKESTTKNDLGIDCISRADVLQILLDYDYANENALVIKDIKALPSVTPQPRKGHWVDNKCTNCGYEVQPWNNTNYCPNCGADMKEVEE